MDIHQADDVVTPLGRYVRARDDQRYMNQLFEEATKMSLCPSLTEQFAMVRKRNHVVEFL